MTNMKLNTELVNGYELMTLDSDCAARVDSREGFKKLMVFYRHDKPVWAHKDCVVAEQARSADKPKKNSKKHLTKR